MGIVTTHLSMLIKWESFPLSWERKMKHKHAEILHAIADGIPVQFKWEKEDWADFDELTHTLPNYRNTFCQWRIKPAEVPQWRKDMAQALKDGKVVETVVIIAHWEMRWVPTTLSETDFLDAKKIIPEEYYRIRPEPDVVMYSLVNEYFGATQRHYSHNLKLTFDANGKLKDAEVL
jgi:hypothetical protein